MTANKQLKYKGHTILKGTDNVGVKGKEVAPYTTYTVTTPSLDPKIKDNVTLYVKAHGQSIKAALESMYDGIDWYISQGWISMQVCLNGESYGEVVVAEPLNNGDELNEATQIAVKVLRGTHFEAGSQITITNEEYV